MTGSSIDTGRRHNRLRPWLWGGTLGLLLLPALAMRLFPEAGVDWTALDFAVMGAMLAVACGLYELGAWMSGHFLYRAAFGLAALTAFLTVWVNLAVGMLGDEDNPANLLFAGVLVVAAIGALLARLAPRGMSRAMSAAGLAQLLAVAIALPMGFEVRELVLTACFALPWFLSALGFRMVPDATARA
jgi:hypothetical protein